VDPLLSSPIVSDAAFSAMLKLARCTAPPLCDYATEIAAALRIASTKDSLLVLDLGPVNDERATGLFDQIATGLSIACKSGPLPADTFSFLFPVKMLQASRAFFLCLFHATAVLNLLIIVIALSTMLWIFLIVIEYLHAHKQSQNFCC
jgi:hypothetical protein